MGRVKTHELITLIVAIIVIVPFGTLILIGTGYFLGYVSATSLFNGLRIPQCPNVSITTISSLYNGIYPSAMDKFGAGGYCVGLRDVKVVYIVPNELDGDVHFSAINSKGQYIEGEITPWSRSQYNVTIPPVNSSINIIGIYYCDSIHKGQLWHSQGSCAEVHPIIAWQFNSTPVSGNFNAIIENTTQLPAD